MDERPGLTKEARRAAVSASLITIAFIVAAAILIR